jgi:hypothetical protein
MRRASKLALLSGEKAIASETGVVFGSSLQHRWRAVLPHDKQRWDSKTLPLFVLKSPPTTSLPKLLKILPDHHQERRELQPRRRHPHIPSALDIAQRPRGEFSLHVICTIVHDASCFEHAPSVIHGLGCHCVNETMAACH